MTDDSHYPPAAETLTTPAGQRLKRLVERGFGHRLIALIEEQRTLWQAMADESHAAAEKDPWSHAAADHWTDHTRCEGGADALNQLLERLTKQT